MISSDGEKWDLITAPLKKWNAVCWSPELRKFCAVSEDSTMVSGNGIDWDFSENITTSVWSSVCWSSELYMFVAVSNE
jgi:hypothetical protein